MSVPVNPNDLASFKRRQRFSKTCLLCLPLLTLSFLGCDSPAASKPQVAVNQEDPVGEFEWGIERLDRALRVFRPSSSDGLNVTDRKLDYELIPPSDENESYTARVTITTEATFLHAKRKINKQDKATVEESKEPENEDLLAQKEDIAEFIDIPGAGPQAPSIPATRIETRTRETETVFELIYVDGHWKLENELESKHEQEWFRYAFE